MRLLVAVAALSLAGAGAYAALTRTPALVELAAPAAEPVAGAPVAPRDPLLATEPPVQTTLRRRTYTVGGGQAQEVLDELMTEGPTVRGEAFFGLTKAEMDIRYLPADVGGACELRDVRVRLFLTVTLPQWEAPPGVSPALARDWRTFQRALEQHEREHQRIAEDGADALYRALAGLRRGSCAEAEADGRRRVNRIQIEIEASHRRFDDETGHGRTEGAVWPQP